MRCEATTGYTCTPEADAVQAEGEVLPVGAPVADLLPQLGDELGAEAAAVGRLAQHDAVEVEEHGGAADEGRERRQDGLEALLLEHDLGELLVHREAALQQRVLLVHDLRGDRLGDGDEGHVVGHLEQREAVLLGHLDERRRHLVEAEAGAEAEPEMLWSMSRLSCSTCFSSGPTKP